MRNNNFEILRRSFRRDSDEDDFILAWHLEA